MNQSQRMVESLVEFSKVVIAQGKTHKATRGGGGIEITNMRTKKSVFLQGEDAEQLEDDLDKAKNSREIDSVLDAFDDVMESIEAMKIVRPYRG